MDEQIVKGCAHVCNKYIASSFTKLICATFEFHIITVAEGRTSFYQAIFIVMTITYKAVQRITDANASKNLSAMHRASGSGSHVSNNQQPFDSFPSRWWNECLRLHLKHLLPHSSTCFLECYEIKFPAGSWNKVRRWSPVFQKRCCRNAPLNMPVGNGRRWERWDESAGSRTGR